MPKISGWYEEVGKLLEVHLTVDGTQHDEIATVEIAPNIKTMEIFTKGNFLYKINLNKFRSQSWNHSIIREFEGIGEIIDDRCETCGGTGIRDINELTMDLEACHYCELTGKKSHSDSKKELING